jgi:hypothetical protein
MIRGVEWAAGLFEGEGTIVTRPRGRGTITETDIQLASTDEDVVRELHNVLGEGFVYGPYQYGNRKPYWKYAAYGPVAISVLRRLLPYLCSRRASRAAQAIELREQRVEQPHYTVSRKGVGGRPTHKNASTDQVSPGVAG